ncbi:morphogenic membrane protein MmpA [Streptomyces sp. NPDC003016]
MSPYRNPSPSPSFDVHAHLPAHPEHPTYPRAAESVSVHRAGRRTNMGILLGGLAALGWTGGMIYTLAGWVTGQ